MTVLRSVASEFSNRIVKKNEGDKLAASLAYGLTDTDLSAVVGENALSEQLKTVLTLQYASQPELNKFNKLQAMKLFGRCPNDTGSPEVQAAILTIKIGYLMKHAEHHKHDYTAKRQIVKLIHDRKKHMKYLKRLSLPRFFELLDKLGLPHDYLEQFENPYLYRYRS